MPWATRDKAQTQVWIDELGLRRVCCALPEPRGLGHEVVPFGDARCPAGGNLIVRDGGRMISGHFQQMGANGVKTVMAGEASIGIERIEQIETRGRAVHHGRGNGVIEHHHGIVRHAFQEIIERQDLRPIGIRGSGGFVMNGGDGGL